MGGDRPGEWFLRAGLVAVLLGLAWGLSVAASDLHLIAVGAFLGLVVGLVLGALGVSL